MSKADIIKAIEKEDDPFVLAAIDRFMKRPSLPTFNPDTIVDDLNTALERARNEGTISLEESKRRIFGNR